MTAQEAVFRLVDEDIEPGESTEIVKADTRVLARLGTPNEQRAALTILMQALNIPSRMLQDDPGIFGQLTKAVQFVGEYGFIPGEHIHAVPRSVKVTDEDGNDKWVESVTIQLGEKAWKASAARHGIDYEIQYRLMTKEELDAYCRSVGAPYSGNPSVSKYACGYFARVITRRMIEWKIVNSDTPPWGSGVWLGVIKQGNKWHSDNLPTAVSPADVAIRRATKRAIMQSNLTLIPLDERRPEERYEALATGLHEQAAIQQREAQSGLVTIPKTEVDENGDILFAIPNPEAAEAARRKEAKPEPEPEPEADDLIDLPEPRHWHATAPDHPFLAEYPGAMALVKRAIAEARMNVTRLSTAKGPKNKPSAYAQFGFTLNDYLNRVIADEGLDLKPNDDLRHIMQDALAGEETNVETSLPSTLAAIKAEVWDSDSNRMRNEETITQMYDLAALAIAYYIDQHQPF